MSNVLRVVPPTAPCEVDEEVVDFLSGLLDQAKEGKFNGIAVITLEAQQAGAYSGLGTMWAGSVRSNSHTALGGVEVLKQRMLNELFVWGVAPDYRGEA